MSATTPGRGERMVLEVRVERFAQARTAAEAAAHATYLARVRELFESCAERLRFEELAEKLQQGREEIAALKRRIARSKLDGEDALAGAANGADLAVRLAEIRRDRGEAAASLRALEAGTPILEQRAFEAHAALATRLKALAGARLSTPPARPRPTWTAASGRWSRHGPANWRRSPAPPRGRPPPSPCRAGWRRPRPCCRRRPRCRSGRSGPPRSRNKTGAISTPKWATTIAGRPSARRPPPLRRHGPPPGRAPGAAEATGVAANPTRPPRRPDRRPPAR